jgi:hypothetical protein
MSTFISEEVNNNMRNKISLYNQKPADNKDDNPLRIRYNSIYKNSFDNIPSENFDSDELDILYNYSQQLGISIESETIILPSTNHYFYDAAEMKNIKAVTSLEELNKSRDLKGFLHSLYCNLQPKTYFIGFFTDDDRNFSMSQGFEQTRANTRKNNENIENGIKSRFPFLNMLYGVLDAKKYNILSGRMVELYLRTHGFKVVDMTMFNGITCFCALRQLPADC